MRKIIYILLLFSINSTLAFSQENIKRVYEISIINYPQKVVLIEYENQEYAGNVITEFKKGKWRTGWFNRTWVKLWNIEEKEIIEKSPIEEIIVEKLMNKLKENEIETIKKCSDDNECNRRIYIHGGSVQFKIKTSNIEREYTFQEIHPFKENNREKEELRSKAQSLITILYSHIDLKQNFTDVLNKLPKGYYHWYETRGPSVISIKNKKSKKN